MSKSRYVFLSLLVVFMVLPVGPALSQSLGVFTPSPWRSTGDMLYYSDSGRRPTDYSYTLSQTTTTGSDLTSSVASQTFFFPDHVNLTRIEVYTSTGHTWEYLPDVLFSLFRIDPDGSEHLVYSTATMFPPSGTVVFELPGGMRSSTEELFRMEFEALNCRAAPCLGLGYAVGDVYSRGEGWGDGMVGTGIDYAFELFFKGIGAQMVINDSGEVGINTAEPTSRLDINGDTLRLRNDFTPPTADSICNRGEIAWSAEAIYVCVDWNTWREAPLSDF